MKSSLFFIVLSISATIHPMKREALALERKDAEKKVKTETIEELYRAFAQEYHAVESANKDRVEQFLYTTNTDTILRLIAYSKQ